MILQSNYNLSVGSKGRRVESVQDILNHLPPTVLPRLKTDGLFGARTEARVKEFQRICGLRATGVVDGYTLDKICVPIDEMEAIGAAFRKVLVDHRKYDSLAVYDGEWGYSFNRMVPVAGGQAVIAVGIVVVGLAFCAVMIALYANAQNQQNPARTPRVAAESQERIRQGLQTRGPIALALTVSQEIRNIANAFSQDMTERKKRCEDKTHEVERSPACIAALEAFTTAVQSLSEKLSRLPGSAVSIALPTKVLVAAVLASVRAIVVALNAIGKECQCPFIIF